MDPLSIAVGCIGISDVIARVAPRISNFIQTVCAAESDLSRIQQQLGQLNNILKFIRRAIRPEEDLPDADRDLVYTIINNCLDALDAVDAITKEYSGRNGSRKWAMQGKAKCRTMSTDLDGNIQKLKLVLQGYESAALREIKLHNNRSSAEKSHIYQVALEISADTDCLKDQLSDQSNRLTKIQSLLEDYTGRQIPHCSTTHCGVDHPEDRLHVPPMASDGSRPRSRIENYLTMEKDIYIPATDEKTHSFALWMTEPLRWHAENYQSSLDGAVTPNPKPGGTSATVRTEVPSLVTASENPIAAKFKRDMHTKARAMDSNCIQVISLDPSGTSRNGMIYSKTSSACTGQPEPRSMKGQDVIDTFQRQVKERLFCT